MFKSALKTALLAAALLAGAAGIYTYYTGTQSARIRQLEEEKRVLREVVGRLTAERRVGELLVTDEKTVAGVKQQTVLFVEYARDGHTLPPRSFTLKGETAHIDAMVIKFDTALVKEGDPLRGSSIALFTRIYGDAEAPDAAQQIDVPGAIPEVYRGADPRVSAFEIALWTDFWTLAHDDSARQARGVRTLMGQGVWEPLRKNTLYTLTLESNGGLNFSREPLKGIYQKALEQARTR